MSAIPDWLPSVLVSWQAVLGRVTACEALPGHHPIFRLTGADGRQYVIKVITEAFWAERLEWQFAVLLHLRERGVPVAAPIAAEDGRLFVERAGQRYWLAPALPSTGSAETLGWESFYQNTGAAIARLHQALAEYRGPTPSWQMNLPERVAETLPQIEDHLEGVVLERFQSEVGMLLPMLFPALSGLPEQVIHGDCHGGNILWEGEQVSGFIDLDHLPRGPRMYDLGYFLADMAKNCCNSPTEIMTWWAGLGPFVAGYAREQPLSAHERKAIFYLMLATQLIFTAWFFKLGEAEQALHNLRAFDWLYQEQAEIENRLAEAE